VNSAAALERTPLYTLHHRLGARMVAFAGYEMPLHYPSGIVAEHLHTRAQAGLFDVSHMGQLALSGSAPERALERLVPGDIAELPRMRMRYTLLLNPEGGIFDDLIVTRGEREVLLVVNAARKRADLVDLEARLQGGGTVTLAEDRALLALQGPAAAAVLSRLAPGIERLPFMSAAEIALAGARSLVSRSGYTGEDGFEIALAAEAAETLAERLLAEPEVKPVGLGARDSLRLEAGLPLWGHDIDETTSPVEASLAWTIGKRRRREGGFAGAERVLRELAEGPRKRRVGIRPEGRVIAREGTPVVAGPGREIGRVTSGGFGPSLGGPVAMGYVESAYAAAGEEVGLEIRGARRPARIERLPFLPARHYRG
jgi:glycine cleavage system T protein (aminomethyltransferase)